MFDAETTRMTPATSESSPTTPLMSTLTSRARVSLGSSFIAAPAAITALVSVVDRTWTIALEKRSPARSPAYSRFQRRTVSSGNVRPRSMARRETPTMRARTLRASPRRPLPSSDSPTRRLNVIPCARATSVEPTGGSPCAGAMLLSKISTR